MEPKRTIEVDPFFKWVQEQYEKTPYLQAKQVYNAILQYLIVASND